MGKKEIKKKILELRIQRAVCRMKHCLLAVEHSNREHKKAFKLWRQWICDLYDVGMIDAFDKFLMLQDMYGFCDEMKKPRTAATD